jgi:hypothetical protein
VNGGVPFPKTIKDTQMHFRQLILGFVSLLLMLSTVTTSYSQDALEPVPIEDSGEIITDDCACDCGAIDSGEIFTLAFEDPFDANRLYMLVMDYPASLSASDVFASIAIVAKSKLQDCIDNVNKKCPEPTKKDGESDADFKKRLDAWRNEWRRQVLPCMKRNQPDAPFTPKKGKDQTKAPWIDDHDREWDPESNDTHQPHWDVTPALPKPKDAKDGKWTDEDGNQYEDKGDYTRVLPPWSK